MGRNVFIISSEDRERYECPFCFLALEDPLQLECGDRVCKACVETIFTSPVRLETSDTYVGYNSYSWCVIQVNFIAICLLSSPVTLLNVLTVKRQYDTKR